MTAPDWHLTALEVQPEVTPNVHYLRPGVPLAGDDESSPDPASDEQTERADRLAAVELGADLAALTRVLLGVSAVEPQLADVVEPSRPEPTPRPATALLRELAFLDPA